MDIYTQIEGKLHDMTRRLTQEAKCVPAPALARRSRPAPAPRAPAPALRVGVMSGVCDLSLQPSGKPPPARLRAHVYALRDGGARGAWGAHASCRVRCSPAPHTAGQRGRGAVTGAGRQVFPRVRAPGPRGEQRGRVGGQQTALPAP